MDIVEIASIFFQAKEKFNQASIKISLSNSVNDWNEYLVARDEYAFAKQQLALAKSEEYVLNHDLGCIPDLSDPKEIFLQFHQTPILLFNALSSKASSNGNYEKMGTAIIIFENCLITQFGFPGEKDLPSHPLFSKGLDECLGIGKVANSSWKTSILEKLNLLTKSNVDKYEHFIFALKENFFECIAQNLAISFSENSLLDTILKIIKKHTHKEI